MQADEIKTGLAARDLLRDLLRDAPTRTVLIVVALATAQYYASEVDVHMVYLTAREIDATVPDTTEQAVTATLNVLAEARLCSLTQFRPDASDGRVVREFSFCLKTRSDLLRIGAEAWLKQQLHVEAT